MALLDLVVAFERESRHYVHGLQFLEQQFTGIGHFQRGHVPWGSTELAPARVSQESTLAAHVHLEGVTRDHQSLQ